MLFLADFWENDHLATIIQNKKIFLTVDHQCYSYQVHENSVNKTGETKYECYHEEADTRIIFHASKAEPGSRILIKASDTDVLIILLGNMHKLMESESFLASSTTKKTNNQFVDCINCTDLALKLGIKLCQSLPAFHAFTGCDYTAAFSNKGKVKPFQIFKLLNLQLVCRGLRIALMWMMQDIVFSWKMTVLNIINTKSFTNYLRKFDVAECNRSNMYQTWT